MVYIIGELKTAEEEREALRFAMRTAKTAEDAAQYRRDFRKARNKVEFIKEKMREVK